ncbi:hypothetical protein ABE132_21545 [Peribacillus simplex]|uniref:hypothetical protein n=1 Tax=Peribacillus simplex TaxID=1478 RepID=UPI003D29A802
MSTFSPFKNGIPITVTEAMIEKILRMKSYGQDIKVEITPKHIVLSGTMEVKKMMFKKNVAFGLH